MKYTVSNFSPLSGIVPRIDAAFPRCNAKLILWIRKDLNRFSPVFSTNLFPIASINFFPSSQSFDDNRDNAKTIFQRKIFRRFYAFSAYHSTASTFEQMKCSWFHTKPAIEFPKRFFSEYSAELYLQHF